ncbi:hypothetical protein [Metabacillus idriensis]|uniref:hypothetical protein n=1 Tax=Metabacillus idriensis TaxID=324768 RepID=UPI001CD234F3|nr:hypothetical protein [Metabacillus idriensis]
MKILNAVFDLDFAYLEAFTNRTDTQWGTLFWNENQPRYFDANHAHVRRTVSDFKLVIDEVTGFYQSKKIIPRFYIIIWSAKKNLFPI